MNWVGKQLSRVGQSLYWRISFVFFLVLVMLGLVYTVLTISMAIRYADETTQKLNANVADHLLKEVSPFVNGKVNEESLGNLMHSMMAVNPGLEVYLLDPEGKIISYVVLHKKVKLKYISVAPIKKFINSKTKSLIYGDDPRNPGKSKIFSAAAVYEKNQLLGYVYLVLASEEFEHVSEALQESYLLKIGVQSLGVTLVAAFLIALLVLWLLMRSLRGIIASVKKFGEGDIHSRIPIHSKGELAALSHTINSMADTLLRNMEELKEVDKLRRDLIANISHDIRTPIAIIHGYAETLIMKQDSLDAEKQREYMRIIMTSTGRLKNLMADLFELSKLESRQVSPKMEVFFLTDLIQDMSCKYKLMAQKKNIHLETELPLLVPIPMVQADVAMIERVLQNLIDNAINYTPENGNVKIAMENADGGVRVNISNTGAGIPEEELPKIFDRYYKIENNKTERGTGLGLAIVKNILEIHQSNISVKSSRSGNTVFSFALPAVLN